MIAQIQYQYTYCPLIQTHLLNWLDGQIIISYVGYKTYLTSEVRNYGVIYYVTTFYNITDWKMK